MVRVLSQQIILAPLNINYNGLLIGDIEAFFGGNFIMILNLKPHQIDMVNYY